MNGLKAATGTPKEYQMSATTTIGTPATQAAIASARLA